MTTTQMTTIARVNIYPDTDGTWCYAAWDDEAHDHNDTLEAGTEAEARQEIARLFPGAQIERV